MAKPNLRSLTDDRTTVTQALPAANANNASASIDLGLNPGRIEDIEFKVELPATPSLADATSVTLKVQDSADNSSFADVADLPTITVTGAGGVGAAAIARQFKFPIGMRRYFRLYQAVANSGGNNTAVSSTLAVVY